MADLPSITAFLAGLSKPEIFIVMEALAGLSPCEVPSRLRIMDLARAEIIYRRARSATDEELFVRAERLRAFRSPPCCATCARILRVLIDLIDSHRSGKVDRAVDYVLAQNVVWLDSLPRPKPSHSVVSSHVSR